MELEKVTIPLQETRPRELKEQRFVPEGFILPEERETDLGASRMRLPQVEADLRLSIHRGDSPEKSTEEAGIGALPESEIYPAVAEEKIAKGEMEFDIAFTKGDDFDF